MADIREVLAEARRLLDGSDPATIRGAARPTAGGRPSLTALYDELRQRLGEVDETRIQGLLVRLAAQIETLNRMAQDVDTLRRAGRAVRQD